MPSDPIVEINTAMETAVAAQEAGDYGAALSAMETAYMRICVLPDSEFDRERLEWDREGIKALIDYLKKRQTETAGGPRGSLIQSNPILYTRG